ncbi:MAG: AAA family ATPase [Spongiibacteraceae bacterium]
MPYLNDRLAKNKEINARSIFDAKASRGSRFTFDPETVIDELKHHIIGQDAVIEAMSDMLYVLKADFSDRNRPLSVNFFSGPTGVGKTETVRVLAKALLGDANQICRIDMNTLAQEHYAAALTGAPPGYVGSKEGHTLFNAEAIEGSFSKPGIVLFDEIEKASKEVIRSILNILDTGVLQLSGGTKTVDFSNAIIFMTSNLGARELAAHQQQQAQTWRHWLPFNVSKQQTAWHIVEPILKASFDPEFLNRIERTIVFKPLERDYIDNIVALEINKLNLRLSQKNAKVALDDTARKAISQHYNSLYGARNIAQLVRLKLNPAIAKAVIKNTDQENFLVTYQDGNFTVP